MEVVIALVLIANMIFPAMVASGIARHKNRGSDEWFVCGVIFGWFAVITVGLLWALPTEVKTCPMCAEDIKPAAKVCRYCRYTYAVA